MNLLTGCHLMVLGLAPSLLSRFMTIHSCWSYYKPADAMIQGAKAGALLCPGTGVDVFRLQLMTKTLIGAKAKLFCIIGGDVYLCVHDNGLRMLKQGSLEFCNKVKRPDTYLLVGSDTYELK